MSCLTDIIGFFLSHMITLQGSARSVYSYEQFCSVCFELFDWSIRNVAEITCVLQLALLKFLAKYFLRINIASCWSKPLLKDRWKTVSWTQVLTFKRTCLSFHSGGIAVGYITGRAKIFCSGGSFLLPNVGKFLWIQEFGWWLELWSSFRSVVVVPVHAMRAYAERTGTGVLQAFLISVPAGGWSAERPGLFTVGKSVRWPLCRKLRRQRSHFGRFSEEKNLFYHCWESKHDSSDTQPVVWDVLIFQQQ